MLTSEGLKKIEDIKIGDKVLATDTKTMKSEYKEVLDTFVRKKMNWCIFILVRKK